MKQRRTMGIGQTICLSLLLVLLGASMFLPVFRFNGTAFGAALNKGVNYMFSHTDWNELGEEFGQVLDKEEIDKAKQEAKEEIAEESEDFEETMKEYEKEHGVCIRQISAFNIMIKSYEKLIYGNKLTVEEIDKIKDDETILNIKQKYNSLRIILWIVYMLAFVLLFVVILGGLFYWSKFVTASITMVYGVIAIIFFAWMRFGMAGYIVKVIKDSDFVDSLDMGGITATASNITIMFRKALSAFYSVGFLVSFILAILLVISCLFIMLTGNRNKAVADHWEGMSADDFNPFGVVGAFPDSGSGASLGMTSIPDQHTMPAAGVTPSTPDMDLTATPTAPLSPMAPPPVAAAVSAPLPIGAPRPAVSAPVGQVKCTMGSAVGQGFRLPADRKVVIGKSPQNANLVINHPNVSNIHCSVRYNASNNSYIVKDHSMNGTFVNGVRLQKEVPMAYPAGTVLSLADGTNQVTLG